MAITDEIKQICAEIAEKLPQISGGGGVKPSLAQIIKRTDLRHWYQHIIDKYYYEYDENYESILNAELMESVEYPLYTQDITDFSNFANGGVYHPLSMMVEDVGVHVKKFRGKLDTSSGTNFARMFWLCSSTEDVGELTDTSNGTDFSMMFCGCSSLTSIPPLDTSSGTKFDSMFYYCTALTSIPPLDTSNGTKFDSMFSSCSSLTSIPQLDISNGTTLNYMFHGCKALVTVSIKNIKANLQVGSGSNYGHLLTVDSLIGLIYECRNTGSIKTLTVGSTNLSKLANVYVKLIDITDEMRAEDGFIDEKKPFEVCESTDVGAMLITNYVGLKNWKLA